MKKSTASKISLISCILLVITPSITLITNDIPADIAFGQYILLFSGILGLIAMTISTAIEKLRKKL
ncbi:hypothetical protein [Pontibacillus yanchengensis]|uniref:Uncharacterized protein n=1 Tax=Pontibacillus yanchengensis Y32 TaxID=1385514 RepID=A0A0A2TNW4_9BACI|nr:hypothetical protein [Pontibacillus yanchengensis]KGP71030.1 hypothetical protein N782_01800 [Pontibacillus yanchengensis Y32]